ncbi:MAG: hypothetical protein WBK95_05340, partial [Sulfurimonas sp.]
YSWVYWNGSSCEVQSNTWQETLEAEIEIENKASFDAVFQPYNIIEHFAVGDVFYEQFSDGYGYGYAKMTAVSATQVTRHEMFYDWYGNPSSEWTMTFDYTKTANMIQATIPISDVQNAFFSYKLDKLSTGDLGTELQVTLQKDYGQDGTIDEKEYREWYTAKPEWFPAGI